MSQSSLILFRDLSIKAAESMITPRLFEDYLNCPTKCILRASNENASDNIYTLWVKTHNERYWKEGIQRIATQLTNRNIIINKLGIADLEDTEWPPTINLSAYSQNKEKNILASECVVTQNSEEREQIPIVFTFRNKISKIDELMLAFNALALSGTTNKIPSVGRIIHGDNYTISTKKMSGALEEAKRIIEKIPTLLANSSSHRLALNRHCPECEFHKRCRKVALEKDDLSLLGNLPDKERVKLNTQGIFGIKQLSYTFRPRRHSKQHPKKFEKYHHSLKALAIRERKIYIVGFPELNIEGTPVYLDVEG